MTAVQQRPWDPTVRIHAAHLAFLLGDIGAATHLVDEHLQLFPSDAAWVQEQAAAGLLPAPTPVFVP